MKRVNAYILAAGVAIGMLASAANAASRTCTIYSDRDFGGSHWTLGSGDDMKMVNAPDVGISDGIHRFIYEPSWNDQVSSFKVKRGCTITLWEHVDRGGHHFRSSSSYSYVGSGWNDKASEAECDCGGGANY
ncbi:peptidase inhibitor family I36 protein [Mesorhizobium sp. B2-3-4]|uniref:peptidase inhibitor family I36 protein n=1 Tax=Mesorhizobium sp. B2-3-4 TaxID=2589959 RepID=UPI001FF02F96|nr:peptidase inhibitor family I36 protein [Mesorhizobium sp. B2-3-4]